MNKTRKVYLPAGQNGLISGRVGNMMAGGRLYRKLLLIEFPYL